MGMSRGLHMAFLDIGMPGMNGYETAKAIRKTAGLENIVLAALTGWGAATDRALSQKAGFDHHLTKPAEFATVKALLSKITSNLEAAQQRVYVVH
jgi:CheY-like chemotaxis protein